MKKNVYLMVILFLSALYSCQQDESDMFVSEYYPEPQFSEYETTSVEAVLSYMDSAYYFEHIDSNFTFVKTSKGKYSIIGTDTNGILKGKCDSRSDCICFTTIQHNEYSYPCDSLMANYGYDTTLADKDFLVICGEDEPTLYQGAIITSSEDSLGNLTYIDFNWINGSLIYENNIISIENE